MYFLSGGSFKMVKNRKKRVNRGHSEVIFEGTRPFLHLKFGPEIRKRQGFSKMTSVFHLYFSVFYKKLITVKKSIFFIIFEWSRFFPGKRALYCRIVWCPLSLCQISKKSLERLPRTFCDELTDIFTICSTAVSLKAHVSTLVSLYIRLLNRILVHLLVNIGQLCNLLLPSCHPYHFFIQVTLLLTSYHIMQLH